MKEDKLYKKWQVTGLLEGLEEEAAKKMSCLLENQARHMLLCTENKPKQEQKEIMMFYPMMLPIVRRAYGKLLQEGLVEIKPMSLPCETIDNRQVIAHSRNLATKWTPSLIESSTAHNVIDAEAEVTATMADSIYKEISNEIKLHNETLIFCPYVPIIVTGLIFRTDSMEKEYGLMMRYGKFIQ